MKIYFSFLFLIFYTVSYSQIKIPKDFIELTESPANGKKIEKVVIDFDDDSINDVVLLVENEKEFSSYRFLIYLTSLKKQYEINLNNTDFSIYPIELSTVNNTIQFAYFEDGTATSGRFIKIRYNSKRKKIQVIGYDTEYKSLPTERIEKSYNLLTGKYIVKRTKLGGDSINKIEEYSGQNDFFKNKVFLENLNAEMIKKLDDVGSKYE
ncbi:hypothetical protein [Aquimarina algiphila]|uniref:hypothetical protein n=1 Tax=Aquimarina algiphila TaxID=2047982 RepID=UPI00232C52E0|nr:hypothetical protein [Aquimarina algiphila]